MTELIQQFREDRILAWRKGRPFTQSEFLSDVMAMAETLPDAEFVVNLCDDRYSFLVAFGAALVRGQVSLLPHSRVPGVLGQIASSYPGAYVAHDGGDAPSGFRVVPVRESGGRRASNVSLGIDPDKDALHAFTSGSSGMPKATAKSWRALMAGGRALEARAGDMRGRALSIVATVPSAHSYGLETTIVPPLFAGAAIHAGRPLFPADIAIALDNVPSPRCLVTTPVHLKALISSSVGFPALELVMCATAPLSLDLAREAEGRLGARILEIYGCTESGFIATRWTTDGGDWITRDDMRLSHVDDVCFVHAGFLREPVPLADVIDTSDARVFRLIGRSSDIVNVAGKRASLSGLGRTLLEIEGVQDGVFVMPDEHDGSLVSRPIALVVAPELTPDRIRRQLQQRIDPAFVPREIVLVRELPRNETGKLPLSSIRALVRQAGRSEDE
jgi:acyl-coenzyme A synthetase/AMP-(fatty) acid ligase